MGYISCDIKVKSNAGVHLAILYKVPLITMLIMLTLSVGDAQLYTSGLIRKNLRPLMYRQKIISGCQFDSGL